jgi:sugar phosphate isomerase/epimerase
VEASVAEKVRCTDRLVLHAPFNELFPCAIDPMVRNIARIRYSQALNMAASYGITRVVIHGGYNPRLYYPIWYTEQSVEFWKEFIREVPEHMTILLENVMEEEIPMFLTILEQVGDKRLRMCLDVGHVNAYSPSSAMDWLEACAPYIQHFHIHNNHGDWDTHNPLGDGTIPMKQLLEKAEELCPEATATLELMEAEPGILWLKEQALL